MSIEIHCQSCNKRYRVKADMAGKRVRCSNCGNPVTVPNGQGHGDADLHFAQDQAPPPVKRQAPPKPAPPPVPRQVVRFDPRFDPQASDIPAPPPPVAPPKASPQRTPQPAARKTLSDSGRELHFIDEDPLSMTKPKSPTYDNLADTAAGPAISENRPEPRLDEEPLIPRGRRGSGKLADTAAAAPPSDEPNLDIAPPEDVPAFSSPSENEAMKKFRADQAAGKERKCTGCGATMKVGAVICLNCGFNSVTGERGASRPGDWDESSDGGQSRWSRLFGKADWRPEDRALRKLCIFGVLVCLFPLIGIKVPQLIKPGIYIAYAGLALALLSAGLFAKRLRITRAAVAAGFAIVAFAVYSSFRPLETDESLARADDAPKNVQPKARPANDGSRAKPGPDAPPTSEVLAILRGPAEGIDPVNWYVGYLSHPDARVRFKSATYLVNNTPPGRKEEIARIFEGRLTDEHAHLRRLAIQGVALYIDDHTTTVLTPLLKDEEEDVRKDVYQLLAKMKDAKALPAIVARMADDGALAREALAAFEASQRPAITRAFELSLKNENPRQRELAARELATYAGPNTPGLLLGLLEDGDISVRCAAVVTLGKLRDPRTLDAILNRLTYDRAAAMTALEAFGAGAEKPVLSLLKSGNTDIRIAAAEVLASIGTKESIPALHEAALDPDVRLSAAAKEAWRKIDPDDFTPAMEAAVDMESDIVARQRAGLAHLCEIKPDKNQDRVAKALVRMAMSDDPQVREATYKVLATWGTKDTAPAFMEYLIERTQPSRRQMAEMALAALKDPRGGPAIARWAATDYPAAVQALGEMGPVAEPSLIDLLMHERVDVRREAVYALKNWGSKQKALPALEGLLRRDRLDRGILEKDVLDAIVTIKDRRDLPKKPLTQPIR